MRKGTVIRSRDGKEEGLATGSTHRCRLEGCLGVRVTTRWMDGKVTHPCSKGLAELNDGTWKIE